MSSLSGPAGLPVTGGPSKANAFDALGNFYLGSGSTPPGTNITSGTNNFMWGSRAGALLTSASGNIAMGQDAGLFLTAAQGTNPIANVYIGALVARNTTGGGNVAIGQLAGGGSGLSQTDVYSMTALGESALASVSASQKDTAVGSSVLARYIRGGQMTGLGRAAGTWVTEGSYSVFIGHGGGAFNVASTENIFIGDLAGYGSQTGTPPRITASQSGTVLTVTAFNAGDAPIAAGMVFVSTTATALGNNITIVSNGTGSGGTGTYNVTPSQTVASQTMQGGFANTGNIYIGQSNGSLGFADSNNIVIGNSVQPASASNITAIGKGQSASYISGDFCKYSTPATINNAAGQTWTAAQVRGGQITRSGAVAVSDTTPTAALIVAAIPGCEVGSTIEFDVINNNTGTLTILAGSGVTLTGTTTIATVFTRKYRARVTNATASSEAVTLYGVSTAAN